MAHGPYDRALMKRSEAARRLIALGEDPYRALAAVVWPGRDWLDEALRARLVDCPVCAGEAACEDCGSTGLVVAA
jgi:hypothetical protein